MGIFLTLSKIIQSINIAPDGSFDDRAVIADEELHENADPILFGRVRYQLTKAPGPWQGKKGPIHPQSSNLPT
jgi:hypothetical protein